MTACSRHEVHTNEPAPAFHEPRGDRTRGPGWERAPVDRRDRENGEAVGSQKRFVGDEQVVRRVVALPDRQAALTGDLEDGLAGHSLDDVTARRGIERAPAYGHEGGGARLRPA